MDRRGLIASVVTAVASAGCSTLDGLREAERAAVTIGEWQFETGVETDAAAGDDPVIRVDGDALTVTVEGIAWYGSSTCGYVTAITPEYDDRTGTLFVKVVDRWDEDEGPCTDDAAAESYRVTVWLDGGIPDRVEAEHPWDHRAVEETG